MYNFDEIIDRRGSGCVKYDVLEEVFGHGGITPLWVADMDWRTPDFILEALHERISHPVMGYGYIPKDYFRISKSDKNLAKLIKRKYPVISQALIDRSELYNSQLRYALEKEKEGSVFILAPESVEGMKTLTKNHSLRCTNPRCITSNEQELKHEFYLAAERHNIYRCIFCESEQKLEK